MNAEVNIKPINQLPVRNTPAEDDIVILIVDGVAYKAQLADALAVLPVATTLEKGLMSAADKIALNAATAAITTLNNQVSGILNPTHATIASANTITVPAGVSFVTLTGTTTITAINGMTNYKPVWFAYPSGAGLTILGKSLRAGDPPYQVIQTP